MIPRTQVTCESQTSQFLICFHVLYFFLSGILHYCLLRFRELTRSSDGRHFGTIGDLVLIHDQRFLLISPIESRVS